MSQDGYLGIDIGTQGLSVIMTDERLEVVATGEAGYAMVPGLPEGCYEQNPQDWLDALVRALGDLRGKADGWDLARDVLSIGISGQMHGEVLSDADGQPLGPARLWCDSRNADEEAELTDHLGVKMPKRLTAVRWLWTSRDQNEKAARTRHVTTPAGWLSFCLTGQWNLGIGDAAGMFPIDQESLNYDQRRLASFNELTDDNVLPLEQLLPCVCRAGEDAGTLHEAAARLLGLAAGTPVAAAEGDQPAAMAGSLIGRPGMVSVSFGTSVCANSIGDRPFQGVSKAVDHFCSVDGKPINMVWLRNGTTFMNTVVEMFGGVLPNGDRSAGFEAVMPEVLRAPADCGGLLALPFMDDEPGLGVERGGTAMLVGLDPGNAHAGNAVKAALLATMFNLRLGCEVLTEQGFPRDEIVLTGGLTKTPLLGQILADVFSTPVTVLPGADEGTAWGAALLAKFRYVRRAGETTEWPEFVDDHQTRQRQRLVPDEAAAEEYEQVYQRYQRLIQTQALIGQAVEPVGASRGW